MRPFVTYIFRITHRSSDTVTAAEAYLRIYMFVNVALRIIVINIDLYVKLQADKSR